MGKQTNKQKQNIYHVFGLNGALNILDYKKSKIIRIDIMQGGIAEKKSQLNKLIKTKIYPFHRLPKDQFLKKYAGKRTQGIVVEFQRNMLQNLPVPLNQHFH